MKYWSIMGYCPSFRAPGKAVLSACLLAFFAAFACGVAAAGSGNNGPVVIRDTEIEDILKEWTDPVIRAAELDPASVHFILVQDKDLNAFVAGGPNVFLYTGLLQKTESPGEVIGVIAHELGHIRGGHLVRTRSAIDGASYESMLGTVLGIGAAIISGDSGVGAAVAAGTQSTAVNKFLAFSRVQESSADQAALDYLEKADMNPGGLASFMGKLESQELLPASQQSEYVRTHPLTRDRLDALTAGRDRSSHKDADWPPRWREQHARMIAKLVAFITPEQVVWNYGDKDTSVAAAYARAIAAYRQNKVDDALRRMDGLLAEEPANPYFLELKAQMLTDFGRVEEALPLYHRAVEIDAKAPLIRTAYAQGLIETSERHPDRLDEAIGQLDRAVQDEPRSGRIFRLLATAYGRKGQEPVAKLYLAEEAVLKQDYDYAKRQAQAALNGLEKGSRFWLRAQDILSYIEQAGKKKN